MDEYRVEGMKQEDGYFSWGSLFSSNEEPNKAGDVKNSLIHPDALHALFELIKFADDESMYFKHQLI